MRSVAACRGGTHQDPPVDKIRVVLADDHPRILASLRSILAEEFEVVAAVGDGSQAMVAVLELEPDLLITDISMPILNGLQVANGLRNTRCRTKIIFVTMHRDPDMIMAAQAAGVSGYVVKTLVASDLIPAVKKVMRGNTFVSC